jgi:colicin import membrane protein
MNALRISPLLSFLSALLLTMSLSSAYAQDASQQLTERYPPGSIETTEKAEAALGDVATTRADVDRLYSNQRIACFDRFFATVCTNDVREKRRAAFTKIRKVEVEANAFLRKEKAAERDRALAERDIKAKQQPGRGLPISGTVREPGANTRDATDAPVNRQP